MTVAEPDPSALSIRAIAEGEGWRVVDVTCRSGPADRPYQELHHWTSIAVVLSGTFTYRSDRGRALMTPGSLLLGSAGTCFECGHEHGRGDRCIAFQFSRDLFEETASTLRGHAAARFSNARLPPLESLLPVLAEVRALAGAPDVLHAEELALSVASQALAIDNDLAEAPPAARDERRVAQAVQIIEARYAQPLSIAGLAREVGMGRRRFASAFRHVVGVTPYNYLLNLRLAAAARCLEDQALEEQAQCSVLEIALDAGFGDLSEFTRRFRARFGRPPALYRRDVRRRSPMGRGEVLTAREQSLNEDA